MLNLRYIFIFVPFYCISLDVQAYSHSSNINSVKQLSESTTSSLTKKIIPSFSAFKNLSYNNSNSLRLTGIPGYVATLSWNFGGSGKAHEILTPLPNIQCSINKSNQDDDDSIISVTDFPLFFLSHNLQKAGIFKKGTKHLELPPLYLFAIKVTLLYLSSNELDGEFIRQELFRLVARLLISDNSSYPLTFDLSEGMLEFIAAYNKEAAEFLTALYQDFASSTHNLDTFLEEKPDARMIVIFEFNDSDLGQKSHTATRELASNCELDDIINVIEEQNAEVIAYDDITNLTTKDLPIHQPILCHDIVKEYTSAFAKKLVGLKTSSWNRLSATVAQKLHKAIRKKRLPLVLDNTNKETRLVFSPKYLSNTGTIRALFKSLQKLFKEYAQIKQNDLDQSSNQAQNFIVSQAGRESLKRLSDHLAQPLNKEALIAEKNQEMENALQKIKTNKISLAQVKKVLSNNKELIAQASQDHEQAITELACINSEHKLMTSDYSLSLTEQNYLEELQELRNIIPTDNAHEEMINKCISHLQERIKAYQDPYKKRMLAIQRIFMLLEKADKAYEAEKNYLLNKELNQHASSQDAEDNDDLNALLKKCHSKSKTLQSKEYRNQLTQQQKTIRANKNQLREFAQAYHEYKDSSSDFTQTEAENKLDKLLPSIQTIFISEICIDYIQSSFIRGLGIEQFIRELMNPLGQFKELKTEAEKLFSWIINHSQHIQDYHFLYETLYEKKEIALKYLAARI